MKNIHELSTHKIIYAEYLAALLSLKNDPITAHYFEESCSSFAQMLSEKFMQRLAKHDPTIDLADLEAKTANLVYADPIFKDEPDQN
jgi:hypothetical protein